jgi:signal peptidase I
MMPNFQDGNYILTEKLSYDLGKPQRGDVVVLKNPRDESIDFIKRIIAVPGDSLKVQGGKVYLNDKEIHEQFLPAGRYTGPGSYLREGAIITIEQNHYFVMGDNREHSSDSREIGPIDYKEIKGKVFFRYWPPSVIGLIKMPKLS